VLFRSQSLDGLSLMIVFDLKQELLVANATPLILFDGGPDPAFRFLFRSHS